MNSHARPPNEVKSLRRMPGGRIGLGLGLFVPFVPFCSFPAADWGQNEVSDSAENGGGFQQHVQALVGKAVAITPMGVTVRLFPRVRKCR